MAVAGATARSDEVSAGCLIWGTHIRFFNCIEFKWSNPRILFDRNVYQANMLVFRVTFTRGGSQTHLRSSCGDKAVLWKQT